MLATEAAVTGGVMYLCLWWPSGGVSAVAVVVVVLVLEEASVGEVDVELW